MPFFVLLGIGQISAFLGAFSLIGQEAPVAERGSVLGMFSLVGAIGILVATAVGGRLFDQIAPWAPFVLIGIANGVLCIAALFVHYLSSDTPSQLKEESVQAAN